MFNVKKNEDTLLPIVTIVYDGLETDKDQQDTDSVTDDTENGKPNLQPVKRSLLVIFHNKIYSFCAKHHCIRYLE